MTQSATSRLDERSLRRRREIQRQACLLTIQRGYQSFTMDDLAEAVGVSRRTLFNAVSDKASALLGPEIDMDDIPAVTTFRDGGPNHDLLPDLVDTIVALTDTDEIKDAEAFEIHRLLDQAMAADPKVHQLVTERFAVATVELANFICTRERWPKDDLRARALAASVFALIRLTLDEHAKHDGRVPFGELFRTTVAAEAKARGVH